jgi:hypothetical protein
MKAKRHQSNCLGTFTKHWWFSGKIGRCHLKSPLRPKTRRPAPGSIPGRCIEQFSRRDCTFVVFVVCWFTWTTAGDQAGTARGARAWRRGVEMDGVECCFCSSGGMVLELGFDCLAVCYKKYWAAIGSLEVERGSCYCCCCC